MQLSVLIAQVPTVWDVATNLAVLRDVLDESRPGDVVVTPEGLLSGYGEDLAPLGTIDPAEVGEAVDEAAALAVRKRVHLFLGSLLPTATGPEAADPEATGPEATGPTATGSEATGWCNAGLYLPPSGEPRIYRKINLAMNERGPLEPGDRLETVPVGDTTAGVQLCREIRFPEQWQHLAAAGARFFVYLTNAANPREPDGVWRSHLVSRAAENQRFVLSANIPHPDQHCPTMVVSPRGEVVAELDPGVPGLLRHMIDVKESGGWYLGQRRRDVVSLTYHPGRPAGTRRP